MPEASMIECPENNSTLGRCEQPKYFLEKIYYGTFTVVGFIVPMIVIITSYYFIMQKVHKSRIQIKKIGTKNDGADSRKNFNRTIMIFFVATLICLLPYICYQIILFYMIPLSSYHCEGFKNVSQSFLIMSPILNAILYSFLGRKFREECFSTFTRIFGFRGRSQRNPTLATDSTAFSGRHSGSRFSRSYPKQESTRISTSVRAMSSSCQEQS
ncbi:Oidioi.mRNA.OKI2018_I69.chr2.g6387.t2.cds [Oikopleura dioica]|uniref:Oidioi.mRNA.OKI2018_I69.chr2.g6387.t2.cds n=1 Tax=Oikopleura dioica TaxID=34765 RepID=A0ABN7T6P3_OIKDI|nr:Oidioi.mRNA.OKI2018_I69.chr2.g6387.t2.cds [Oikopleura dioica]